MSLRDPLLHPALIDPRQWGEIDLYGYAFNTERSPIEGKEQRSPDLPFRMIHLALDLLFDEAERRISGTAACTLAPFSDGLGVLRLDAAELDISLVRLAGSGTPLRWECHREQIVIWLDRSYRRDEKVTIIVSYSARPRKGLFFIGPDEAYPSKPLQIWSQGENEDAHWWFPCHDVTNQKMTTELRATVREDLVALSNGNLIEVRSNVDGTRTFHWKLDQPHPAYLVSVVIGKYAVIHDDEGRVPLAYYLYPDRLEEGQQLFARTRQMIEFFSSRFGVNYPYPKYYQALVADFLFGAMENTSATTMTDRCLLDERAGLDLNYDDIVAHELAHQWWGNLVTCKDWSQIWLNESFATYSEYLWREEQEGADQARWALFQDFLVYLREDLTSHRRPLVCRKYRFSEELMDRHAYEKGACILHMLRGILGDEQFFRSLKLYLTSHAHSTAETHDFKVAIEKATGRNLGWFFEQWIWGEGYPELEVTQEWSNGQLTLSVRQLQALEGRGQVFRLPIEIEVTSEDSRVATWQVEIEQAEQKFYFLCPSRPIMTLFDKGEQTFKLIRFDKSLQELVYQATSAGALMDRVRAVRELSAWRMSESINTLADILNGNEHPGLRMAAVTSLAEIGGDQVREILVRADREADDPAVHRTILWALGLSADPRNIPIICRPIEPEHSYFVAVGAVRSLAHIAVKTASTEAFDILSAAIDRTSWQEVVAAAVFHGFHHARDCRALDLAIAHSAYGRPLPIRLAAIGCLGAIGIELRRRNLNADSARVASTLVDLLSDPNPRARTATIRALGKLGDSSALPRLRQLSQTECLDMIRGALLDAISRLESPPNSLSTI